MKVNKKHSVVFFCCFISAFFFLLYFINSQENNKTASTKSSDRYFYSRLKMVKDHIKGRGITNKATLKAMMNVKRELFVPVNLKSKAYDDRPLPIGYGQTISQPYIVAYMTEKLEIRPEFKVLEVGTGSGYQAAVLAEIADKVYTIEIIPELGKAAKAKFQKLAYKNVEVKIADGYYGWKEHAPFDAIIVTAASGYIPPPLIEQLKEGGKMIIPVGSPFMTQYLVLVKKANGKTNARKLLPVRFVPFTRKEK